MNISSLPTDNLYKFMSIFGLVVLIFSASFPINLIHNLELEMVKVETENKLIDHEASLLEKKITKAEKKETLSTSEVQQLKDDANNIKIKHIISSGEIEKLRVLSSQLVFSWGLAKIGASCGLTLSILGFLLWYFLVQKPMDLKATLNT